MPNQDPQQSIEKSATINPEQSISEEKTDTQMIIPKWLRIFFKIYAVLIFIYPGTIFILGLVGIVVGLIGEFYFAFWVSSMGSEPEWFPFYINLQLVFSGLVIIGYIVYCFGIFKLKRWIIPVLLIYLGASVVNIVGELPNFNLFSLILTLPIIVLTYFGYKHRSGFSGKYFMIVPIIAALVAIISLLFFQELSQLFKLENIDIR